jgi:type VI secretion system protein VasD
MRLAQRKFAPAALLALGMVLSACSIFGGGGDGKPEPIKVRVDAAPRLNPDEHGRALTTVVRIYQLKNASKMESAEFEDLYRREKELLGEDLVQVDELEVPPGQQVGKTISREKGAQYVAAVALFRRPGGFSWRSIVELPKPSRRAELTFGLEEYRINLK